MSPHTQTLHPSLPLAILFILIALAFAPASTQAYNPYIGCRSMCNAAYMSCMQVYGES